MSGHSLRQFLFVWHTSGPVNWWSAEETIATFGTNNPRLDDSRRMITTIDKEDFIRRLPKAELHLHLEGTILPSTLVELSARHDAKPMTLREAKALYRFDDFTGFIECFKAVTRRLIDPKTTNWSPGA
jgi:hypothetical protein